MSEDELSEDASAPGGLGPAGAPGRAEDAGGVDGLKVAQVLGTSAGGVGRHVRSVAAGLVERGARVVVFGPASTEEQFGFTAAGAGFVAVDITDRPRPMQD